MRSLLTMAILAAGLALPAKSGTIVASQNWVRDYVATNTTKVEVDADWIASYLTTSGVIEAIIAAQDSNALASNTVNGIVNQTRLNAMLARTYTNSALRVVWAPSCTSLTYAVFAPLSSYWTNAVFGASVITSDVNRITLNYGDFHPWTTNGTIQCFSVSQDGVVSTNGIDFIKTKVSDVDIIKARGN